MINKIIYYFLHNRLVTMLVLLLLVGWGLVTSPFGWDLGSLPSNPVPVDAIPDIGENQQIVYTSWPGRSPQDVDDQITYPLTSSLIGIPGVKSIRSSSIFGVSSIYLIFEDEVEFYWSRSRILEKLNSLPANLLPQEVKPSLGPDATALGQVYWYTLEGRDSLGNPTGGWDLHELRSIQDFYVKYALNSTEGVAEVASIGGFVREYQIDVNPDALQAYNISLSKVIEAARMSNRDVGAKTIEINQVEYLVRGLGYIKSIEDLEDAVVEVKNNVPITIRDIGVVSLGPATRRGILDKDGAEVVGGVVVARYGSNPLEVIHGVKKNIKQISAGLPSKIVSNGVKSQLTLVPFYDRTHLIQETLGTLEEALTLEILISILVIVVMIFNLRASILITSLLPISVLMVFIAMKNFGVDANIVALSGIAIAIGTMVDLGIVLAENIVKRVEQSGITEKLVDSIYNASKEVSSAIVTAVATTVVSFIPVFAMQASEGKLFIPLAFTKTFALVSALLVTLLILPTFAYWFLGIKVKNPSWRKWISFGMIPLGILIVFGGYVWAGVTLTALAISQLILDGKYAHFWAVKNSIVITSVISITWILALKWMPLGAIQSQFMNFLFVLLLIAIILGAFWILEKSYGRILTWCLQHKKLFFTVPIVLIFFGALSWFGFTSTFSILDRGLSSIGFEPQNSSAWRSLDKRFPGLGNEFMPSLDEGSFLLMPTSMPHSGVEYNKRTVQQLDMLLSNIPEVDLAVGKMGRTESALDPAPISMFENIINYKPEFVLNEKGHGIRYRVNGNGEFETKDGEFISNKDALASNIQVADLIESRRGRFFRNWRDHIKSPDDIWNEIVAVTKLPGVTSAPKLQPIQTRLVMLQTGMRAPMGIKVSGSNLEDIEAFGRRLEEILKTVPSVKAEAVFADRIVGKPYLHLNIDRKAIARYGLHVEDVQKVIETAIGGMPISSTVEGRERYPIRVRYPRELRDDPTSLEGINVPTKKGNMIPLGDLVTIEYVKGPQMIKSENTFLTGYVLFDKYENSSEVEVVEAASQAIDEHIASGQLEVPNGVNFKFSGSYENQVRAEKRLALIVPIVGIIIFLILYFQFKSISTSLMIFTGILLAFSGGFIVLWSFGQEWFMNFSIFGTNLHELFHMKVVNLSVAVWVGFIALFGIATDDGVLIATYLDQSFAKNKPQSVEAIRLAVKEAGKKRIRPAIMTTATTIIALLPILTSSGRGADIMIPMAIPAFGGMLVASVTYFITPVLYSWREEFKIKPSA